MQRNPHLAARAQPKNRLEDRQSRNDPVPPEDLTGCIPLLLNPFLEHHEKPLKSLEPQIWDEDVLASVGKETNDFANTQKLQLTYVCSFDRS